MSAHTVLNQAVEAVLGSGPGFGVVINGVFDSPPQRAVRPYAVIDDAVLVDWSTKDMIGREGRLSVVVFGGEDRKLLRRLADAVTALIPTLPSDLGEGWRIASLAFVRSRIFREGPGLCAAVVEFRVRMLQAN